MKDFSKLCKYFFSGTLTTIASIASIIGLIVAVVFQNYTAIIALSSIIVFLIILLFRIYQITRSFVIQRTHQGYNKLATYARYSTEDGKHITYELYKYIQCKSIIMDEHVHYFHWSGTNNPVINSALQEYKEFYKTPKGQFDKAVFKFKKPLIYNDFTIVHIKMELDDSDFASEPYCEQSIKEPIQLISFRIELRDRKKSDNAKISRRKLDTPIPSKPEVYDYASFNETTMSYETIITSPDVGYAYSISWNRIKKEEKS